MIFNDFNVFLTSSRHIIDGRGASAVFNGHTPLVDKLYTKSNHYISGMYVTYNKKKSVFSLIILHFIIKL